MGAAPDKGKRVFGDLVDQQEIGLYVALPAWFPVAGQWVRAVFVGQGSSDGQQFNRIIQLVHVMPGIADGTAQVLLVLPLDLDKPHFDIALSSSSVTVSVSSSLMASMVA